MRTKRRRNPSYTLDRRWLFAGAVVLAFIFATLNCSILPGTHGTDQYSAEQTQNSAEVENANLETASAEGDGEEQSGVLSDQLYADALDIDEEPRTTTGVTDTISIDVRNADLLDVLSMIAIKLDGNIIFLGESDEITLKTSQLSPITTLQTVLQKKGLDYLTIGRNYIVGDRERLYDDFDNRMLLSRYNLFYVAAGDMEDYILDDLDVPVEILTTDTNQQALWMQGTPMALGKAREVINALDVIENAAFAEGGGRNIRMPINIATGPRAVEELDSLIQLLSILLDGIRDSEAGWSLWDHPHPIPRVMSWDSPVIKPNHIKMKVTPDLDPDPNTHLHYLLVEGTPDNIELVKLMIEEIAGTPGSPFPFVEEDIEEEEEIDLNENIRDLFPDNQSDADDQSAQGGTQQDSAAVQSYEVDLKAVPADGGRLSGQGSYSQGTRVTASASPAEDYEFVRWIKNGAEMSTAESYTFSIHADLTLEAVFSRTDSGADDQPQDDLEAEDEEVSTDQE